jgi:hypothetical protein
MIKTSVTSTLRYLETFHEDVYKIIPEHVKDDIREHNMVFSHPYNDREFIHQMRKRFCCATTMAEMLGIDYPEFQSQAAKGHYDGYRIHKISGINMPGSRVSKYWYDIKLKEKQ